MGGMKRVVHAACPHDCPDACAVHITVEDGRAIRMPSRRAIRDGDIVRVFNDRGEVRLRARVSARPNAAASGLDSDRGELSAKVQPGVVAVHLNWAKLSTGGRINMLTSERLTDLGGGPTFYSVLFYSVLVQVERAE